MDAGNSVSELSFQDGSIYNSDIIENSKFNQDEFVYGDVDTRNKCSDHNLKISLKDHNQQQSQKESSPTLPVQIEELQEEIVHLRAQIALLKTELVCRDKPNEEDCVDFDSIDTAKEDAKEEFVSVDLLKNEEINCISINSKQSLITNEVQQQSEQTDFSKVTTAQCRKTNNIICSPSKHSIPTDRVLVGNNCKNATEQPVSKIAERVKLRKTMENNWLTGTDLTSSQIQTTEIAEHLVADLILPDSNAENKKDFDMEIRRLHRKIDHLKLQNSVLSLTLSENKQHCNHLYLLCGKYESNAIALAQALAYSDRAIEAYDVMLALLESKFGIQENVEFAEENRKTAESVAHLLLDRLNCESSFYGNSLWQDAVAILSESDEYKPWTEDQDRILRSHVSKLKGLKSAVQSTILNLESPFYTDDNQNEPQSTSPPNSRNSRPRQKCMDLETAVLMQELLSMREEIGELKYKVEKSEREKNLAYEKLKALNSVLMESEALLALQSNERYSFSEAEHNASIERELMEALGRESRLKSRLQTLALSLENAAKKSEERHNLVQNTVSELKTTNLNLSQTLEKCQRKYQSKIRRLEQQILDMKLNNQLKNRNDHQLKTPILDNNASSNNAVSDSDPGTTL